MDESSQEITTLVGREVYSNNGVFVGEVEDLQLDLDQEVVTGLALGALNNEVFGRRIERGKGILLPYRWVRAVGDVVLVNDVIERFDTESEQDDELVA